MYIWFTHKVSSMDSMRKALRVVDEVMVIFGQSALASSPALATQIVLHTTKRIKFEQIRKALMMVATVMVIFGQLALATNPAQAATNNSSTANNAATKQQPVGQTTTTATQQGSVSPPPAANNDGGAANDNVASGGDSLTTTNNQQSNPPANKSVGIVADPAKDQGKGNVGIVADPVKDPSKDNAASKTGNTVIHCSPGVGCSTKEDLGVAPKDDKSSSSSSNSKEDPDASEPAKLIHCRPGTGCSQEDASDQKAATVSADAQVNSADDGELHGCPYDYEYREDLGRCWPGSQVMGFFPVLEGTKPFPTTYGGVVAWVGHAPADFLQMAGDDIQDWLDDSVGNTLSNLGDQIGGPVGWGLQGLGATTSATGVVAGVVLEGLGQVVGGTSDAVGDAVDTVIDTAEGVGDIISDWF